jgi:ribosomal protein S18 acetylase RimI-like enzyme
LGLTQAAKLRPAEPRDATAIASCVAAAYRHYIGRIGRPPGPMLDDYDQVIRQQQVFVFEHEGQVAGVVVLIRKAGGILLDNVALDPSCQGKGLGRRLIAFAEAHARDQGFAYLDLYTHERMTENIDMYKHLGYVETERRSERGYERVYMRKSLGG